MPDDLRDRLANAETTIRRLREERGRLSKLAAESKAVATETQSDTAIGAAVSAKEAVEQVDAQIASESERQVLALRELADRESGRSGFASVGLDGWAEASRRLNPDRGDLRFEVSAAALLNPTLKPVNGQSIPSPAATSGSAAGVAPSNRWIYPALASSPFGSGGSGDLSATDYRTKLSTTEATLTGSVEVETASDDQKSVMAPDIELVIPQASTFAVIAKNLPSVLFNSQDSLRAALSNGIGRRLSDAYDDHVIAAIEGDSALPNGSTGSDLVAKIRNAIADAHDLGSEPTILALTPSDAAALDLTKDDGGYTFRVDAPRVEGAGSTVWSLRVREAAVAAPLLVDEAQIGLTYYGSAEVMIDPFSGLSQNLVRARVEALCRFHVRDASVGAYQIS
ncbi:MAG: hypothetical protein ACRDK1_00620 [Solirubrobacterales bacterium]